MKCSTKIWFRVRLRRFLVRRLNIGSFGLKTAHFADAHIDHTQTVFLHTYCVSTTTSPILALFTPFTSWAGKLKWVLRIEPKREGRESFAGKWKNFGWLFVCVLCVYVLGETVTEGLWWLEHSVQWFASGVLFFFLFGKFT